MRYSDVKDFILEGLAPGPYADVFILPGPDDRNAPPGRFLMPTMVGGPGLNTDALFDARSWQILAVGEQNDYSDAESLAFAVDAWFISMYSRRVNGIWVTSALRQGGPPTPLPTADDADRIRFTCTYIFDVQSSVA